VAVAQPELLVLDEPTRGIDPERKAEIARWLAAYAAAGRGVLVATHDRSFPAHRRVSLPGLSSSVKLSASPGDPLSPDSSSVVLSC